MPKYKVYVFCDECGIRHLMPVIIALDHGLDQNESTGDIHAGKKLPPEIAKLLNTFVRCPNTGKRYVQEGDDRVFLVPVEW
ncbi:MAG: hypothetical protein JSW35_04845 [Deltaproteobacteria bacterium]|nr:MAG: hypothetical protein JSW35_04845 [Deltaproteobacteria bacterium]